MRWIIVAVAIVVAVAALAVGRMELSGATQDQRTESKTGKNNSVAALGRVEPRSEIINLGAGTPADRLDSLFKQAVLYALAAMIPAWLVAGILFRVIGHITLLPLQLSAGLLLLSALLTLTMCLLSGLAAMRRVLDADPAEVF
jgi:hypothetical protein